MLPEESYMCVCVCVRARAHMYTSMRSVVSIAHDPRSMKCIDRREEGLLLIVTSRSVPSPAGSFVSADRFGVSRLRSAHTARNQAI
jgi:hypothetical protein